MTNTQDIRGLTLDEATDTLARVCTMLPAGQDAEIIPVPFVDRYCIEVFNAVTGKKIRTVGYRR